MRKPANNVARNIRRGVWVPAFAGTTKGPLAVARAAEDGLESVKKTEQVADVGTAGALPASFQQPVSAITEMFQPDVF